MHDDDTYKTIKDVSEGLYREKGSKFLSFAHPVSSVEEAKTILDDYHKKYYDARHVCYAYSIGPQDKTYRINDDGEPSGTAGRPIYGQIQSYGVTNVLVIVVRYFGGVLLGTGGLVVAYKTAASEALSAAEILEKTVDKDFNIRFEFPFLNDVMRIIKNMDVQIVSQEFGMDCTMCLRIRKSESERLSGVLEKVETLQFTD
jgi:uncharacterized YigZ family protein